MAKRDRPDPASAEPLPEGTPSGWYADPLGEKKSRYWEGRWTASVQNFEPKPVPPPRSRLISAADVPGIACTCIGGFGWDVVARGHYKLAFDSDGLTLRHASNGVVIAELPYHEIIAF